MYNLNVKSVILLRHNVCCFPSISATTLVGSSPQSSGHLKAGFATLNCSPSTGEIRFQLRRFTSCSLKCRIDLIIQCILWLTPMPHKTAHGTSQASNHDLSTVGNECADLAEQTKAFKVLDLRSLLQKEVDGQLCSTLSLLA